MIRACCLRATIISRLIKMFIHSICKRIQTEGVLDSPSNFVMLNRKATENKISIVFIQEKNSLVH